MKALAPLSLFSGMIAAGRSGYERSWTEYLSAFDSEGSSHGALADGGSKRGLRLGAPSGWIVGRLRLWRQNLRDRRQLRELDQRMLQDIGLSWREWQSEISKPFWR